MFKIPAALRTMLNYNYVYIYTIYRYIYNLDPPGGSYTAEPRDGSTCTGT